MMGFDEPLSGGSVPWVAGAGFGNDDPVGFADEAAEEAGTILDVAFLAVKALQEAAQFTAVNAAQTDMGGGLVSCRGWDILGGGFFRTGTHDAASKSLRN